jgi:hypothetical protein
VEIRRRISETPLDPPCNLKKDIFEVVEDFFEGIISRVDMADESSAYQLQYLSEMGAKIKNIVLKRFNAKRNQVDANWRELLDQKLERNKKYRRQRTGRKSS